MTPKKLAYPSREEAETLAIDALVFLVSEPEALGRFLALTGIDAGNLRAAAAEPGFLAGLLDYYLADERLLLEYAGHAGLSPDDVIRARHAIAAEGSDFRDD